MEREMGTKVAAAGGKDMNKTTGEIRISVLPPLSLSNSASHCCFTALLVPLAGGGIEDNSDGAVAGSGRVQREAAIVRGVT
jgi:hypothetical protein